MIDEAIYLRVISVLEKKNSIGICFPPDSPVDTIAAGIALYLGLTKMGKNVSLACSSDVAKNTNLRGADKIQNSFISGGDNLVVSFPYSDGSVDKVTYNIEGDNFNLLIVPKEGQPRLDSSQVKYSYMGGTVDAIVTIDSISLNALQDLFETNKDQFTGRDIINIDRHLTNTNFGTMNLIEKDLSSTSEIILRILQRMNIKIDSEIATLLYSGIINATNNFLSFSVSAATFEASAYLLNQGAQKTTSAPVVQNTTNGPSFSLEDTAQTFGSFSSHVESETQIDQQAIEKKEIKEEKTETPKDWLKPKIFKGRNLV